MHLHRKCLEKRNNASRSQLLKKNLLWRPLAAFYRYAAQVYLQDTAVPGSVQVYLQDTAVPGPVQVYLQDTAVPGSVQVYLQDSTVPGPVQVYLSRNAKRSFHTAA